MIPPPPLLMAGRQRWWLPFCISGKRGEKRVHTTAGNLGFLAWVFLQQAKLVEFPVPSFAGPAFLGFRPAGDPPQAPQDGEEENQQKKTLLEGFARGRKKNPKNPTPIPRPPKKKPKNVTKPAASCLNWRKLTQQTQWSKNPYRHGPGQTEREIESNLCRNPGPPVQPLAPPQSYSNHFLDIKHTARE